jgi:hypothetical protein
LVRPVNNSSNGKVKSCQIHDMVLESGVHCCQVK